MRIISLFFLLISRQGLSIAIWITNAWEKTWAFLKDRISWLLSVFLGKGFFLLANIAFLTLVYQNRDQVLGRERFYSCPAPSNIQVAIGYPNYIAVDEIAELNILVHNVSNQKTVENLRVVVASRQGQEQKGIWFPDGNSLEIDKLGPLAITQKAMRILLPAFVSSGDVTLDVFVQQGEIPPKKCRQSIPLKIGKLRRWFVSTKNLTYYADVILKILGLITAFVTAFLTLSGKWSQMRDKISEWTKDK